MARRGDNSARKLSDSDGAIRRQHQEEERRLDEQFQRIQQAQWIREEQQRRHEERQRRKEERIREQQALQSKAEEKRMSNSFVLFAGIAVACVLFCAVNYLQLRDELTQKRTQAAQIQLELSKLQEENDEYYSSIVSNVDMSEIKKIALGHLGMRYPSESQMMEYETTGGSYVKQFQDVPETK